MMSLACWDQYNLIDHCCYKLFFTWCDLHVEVTSIGNSTSSLVDLNIILVTSNKAELIFSQLLFQEQYEKYERLLN